ncbi:MAG: extracellular solute-binding protein [Clostridia bacterium]|nr:extracellular solute-binding protein [Clostridia bacterium]
MKKFFAFCIAIIITVSQLLLVCEANQTSLQDAFADADSNTYSEYISEFSASNEQAESASAIVELVSDGAVKTDEGAVRFEQNNSFAEYKVNVPKDGWYNIKIGYLPLEGKSSNIQFSLKINGKAPFKGAEAFVLNRFYADDGIDKDYSGNEIRTPKREIFFTSYTFIYDNSRVYPSPLLFKLKTGENIITLDFAYALVEVKEVRVTSPSEAFSYNDYKLSVKQNGDNSNGKDTIVIQAETPEYTSSKMLYPTYDRQSAITQSSDGELNNAYSLNLNTIGQSSWKQPGQIIAYSFTVKNSGFYHIGMRAKQSEARGIFSTRKITIDGELLFDELASVSIPFDNDWQIITLGAEEPYEIWLDAGKHTIEFESVSGIIGAYTERLEKIVASLNELYRKVIMITGTSPDVYRDYRLENQIPDLKSQMKELSKQLASVKNEMLDDGVQKGSDMVVIDQITSLLDSFEKRPRTIPERLNKFQDAISSLSSWILTLKEQPLEMDYIFIEGNASEKRKENAGFFETIVFRFRMFLSSFTGDYYQLSDASNSKEALKVWVALSRDQTQVISDLINNDFKAKYNSEVTISLVKQSLVTAIAAGTEPDVSLYAGDVVNLAARNSLCELSSFAGFEEVKTWFSENAFVPYTYNSGVYAMPLQQSFLMMFYRTDIFEDLGIKPPKTWDELDSVITILQKNKLNAGVPASASIFNALLFQAGGNYYNENQSKTRFDEEVAVTAFTKWTEFYTKYRLPQSFSGLVRFRSGEMPLLLENYTFYNTLAVGAPEISGLWEMVSIPGTLKADGTIDNTTVSSGSGAVILNSSKNKELAFEFVKWFASAEIQYQYGQNVENILGSGSRYDPANINALSELNWSPDNIAELTEQLVNSTFEPVITASYYVGRNLDNAYRAVTLKGLSPREALYSYNVDINAEIKRKRAELGIEEE